MTYDDAGWHFDSVIEQELPTSAASTHIGIFMAWLAINGLTQPEYVPAELLNRTATPGAYLRRYCADQIDPGMLTAAGNRFTTAAYDVYLARYDEVSEVARHGSTYQTPDTWDTYDAVGPLIDQLYADWRNAA